jgi:hypothetical protein
MKTLLLSLILLAPAGAHAGSLVNCTAKGQGGIGRDLAFSISSGEGLLNDAADLNIRAQGLRLTVYAGKVTGPAERGVELTVVPFTAKNVLGESEPVKGRLELETRVDESLLVLTGNGKIVLPELPPEQFDLHPEYTLTDCRGAL